MLEIKSIVDQILSLGGNIKVVCFSLVIVAVIIGIVCMLITKNPTNLGVKVAEEVIEEVVEKETGINLDPLFDRINNALDKNLDT